MIEVLKDIGLANEVYKIILDCEDKNVEFYKKVDYLKINNDSVDLI